MAHTAGAGLIGRMLVLLFGGILLVARLAEPLGGIGDEHVGVIRAVRIVADGAFPFFHRRMEQRLETHVVAVGAALVGRGKRFESVPGRIVIFMTVQTKLEGGGAVDDFSLQERSVAVAAGAVVIGGSGPGV